MARDPEAPTSPATDNATAAASSGGPAAAPVVEEHQANLDWHDKARHLGRRTVALAHYARIRFAHFILLPELNADQAYDLRQQVRKDGELTQGYILMCALAAGIATLGLLQSSTAVVIGAMLVSPLMSPIAALGFGFASLDGHRIRDAVKVVALGALLGIVTGMLLTWLSPIRNATPEILARTQPTLLDLAIALFSGIAGGYSTVIGKGGTAIGVAIATALMPPLTVIGYGIGVGQPLFALGAMLLFLTNLAAITLAFAVVARLSGAARPFGKVEWTPRYIAILVAAFLALATPLSMTLMRLSREATLRSAAQTEILAAFGQHASITQLDVKTPMFDAPSVTALVITPSYVETAQETAQKALRAHLSSHVEVSIQQVLAADVAAQTKAMVDAAMERTAAGIAADVPPFAAIRASLGLPTRAIWTDRAQRQVYVEPVAAPGWTLADYRTIEQQADAAAQGWSVRVEPPAEPSLLVALPASPPPPGKDAADAPQLPPPTGAVPADLAVWALQRWGMGTVTVAAPEGSDLTALAKALDGAGIKARKADATPAPAKGKAPAALVTIYAPSPAEVAAQKAAAAKAAQDAKAASDAKAANDAKAAGPGR